MKKIFSFLFFGISFGMEPKAHEQKQVHWNEKTKTLENFFCSNEHFQLPEFQSPQRYKEFILLHKEIFYSKEFKLLQNFPVDFALSVNNNTALAEQKYHAFKTDIQSNPLNYAIYLCFLVSVSNSNVKIYTEVVNLLMLGVLSEKDVEYYLNKFINDSSSVFFPRGVLPIMLDALKYGCVDKRVEERVMPFFYKSTDYTGLDLKHILKISPYSLIKNSKNALHNHEGVFQIINKKYLKEYLQYMSEYFHEMLNKKKDLDGTELANLSQNIYGFFIKVFSKNNKNLEAFLIENKINPYYMILDQALYAIYKAYNAQKENKESISKIWLTQKLRDFAQVIGFIPPYWQEKFYDQLKVCPFFKDVKTYFSYMELSEFEQELFHQLLRLEYEEQENSLEENYPLEHKKLNEDLNALNREEENFPQIKAIKNEPELKKNEISEGVIQEKEYVKKIYKVNELFVEAVSNNNLGLVQKIFEINPRKTRHVIDEILRDELIITEEMKDLLESLRRNIGEKNTNKNEKNNGTKRIGDFIIANRPKPLTVKLTKEQEESVQQAIEYYKGSNSTIEINKIMQTFAVIQQKTNGIQIVVYLELKEGGVYNVTDKERYDELPGERKKLLVCGTHFAHGKGFGPNDKNFHKSILGILYQICPNTK